MRVLYFDAFAGVSGDMSVAALLDLGLDLERLRAELAALPLNGYALRATPRTVNGIVATKFDVDLAGAPDRPHHDHHHAHRAFADIRAMIDESRLTARVKETALAIFTRLAEAEGHVHGTPIEQVTFHEVGAVDSIIDIVGTAIGLAALDVGRVYVSPLPLGSGLVRSQHGVIPVPGPATAELLRGFPSRIGDGDAELVTPTGAAIVATLARPGEVPPSLRIEAVGYGAGTRVLADRPNLLRLLLGRIDANAGGDQMIEVAATIDDANPELYAHALEAVFAAGARDVWLVPAIMKKQRPGVVLHALADVAARDAVAAAILRETTAIGVRFHAVQRLVLPRQIVEVQTPHGRVRVKLAVAPDGTRNVAPEYEDCRRLACERGVALKLVYQAAIAAALGIRGGSE